MTVEQHDVVDFASIDASGDALLVISDHLAWDDTGKHLLCLQEKLNMYLRFLESGEVWQKCPSAIGRRVVIDVVLKYPAPLHADWFFDKAKRAIEAAGFGLRTRCLPTLAN
jgi:hypothetical protein